MILEDTNEEKFFRERYAAELRKKSIKQLDDEGTQLRQQNMRTPGRRGDEIKREEFDREILHRFQEGQVTSTKKSIYHES